MCGDSIRPTFGGTIAVLFPSENRSSSSSSHTSEQSRSSSPDSVASSTSSVSSLSSYSLFFRDNEKDSKTKAIFQIDDAETYEMLRECRQVDMRIEQYGDLSTPTNSTPPLHKFRLDLASSPNLKPGQRQTEMEFELPERLDLGVSTKGVVGRQVTVSDAGGAVLGVGIVGYN
ncbi:uncharacterized protein N7482_005999 [Penicillium canariense]|uniref:Uncharacterized protein n=1 Tax=Penicillium canariense TaxID=189055 RepID=A0A9W9I5M2_9EURO|nr:uncharacterized protein N7482_005999 [Penicillium canariense]KAJ5167218.1 hypothetical protein N7482_005999 [Penicillium canariense]